MMWLAPAALLLLQQVGQVSGTVREDSTLIPLANVSVVIPELDRGSVSDSRGRFVVRGVRDGTWTVVATTIGHDTTRATVSVGPGGYATIDLLLGASPVVLSGINVDVLRIPSVGPSRVTMRMETLSQVPALAEVDLLRSLEVLPSVATTSEYSTALYVRGGTPDQTDILLDGFPVFNPYHLGGLYAAFNPDVVSTVDVVSGAMAAPIGSRISSVVAVETREGGDDRLRGRGTLSLSSIGAALDGPIPALPGTFVASARQSLRNLTGGGLAAEGLMSRTLDVGFHDLLAKWTVPVAGGALEGLSFSTAESVDLPQPGQGSVLFPALRHEWGWGSRLVGFSVYMPLGAFMRMEARAGSSRFDTALETWWQVLGQKTTAAAGATGSMRDRMVDLSVIASGSAFGARHQLTVGGELRRSDMAYRSSIGDEPPAGLWNEFVPTFDDTFRQDVHQFWVEDEITFASDRMGVRLGVRGTSPSGLRTTLQPRAGVRLGITDWLALTAGTGRYAQGVHSIRVEESLATNFMAFDLQRPARRDPGMPEARDVVVSAEARRGAASVRVDAYEKRYENLYLAPLPSNPWQSVVLEIDSVAMGAGASRGLELLADYVKEPVSVWVSYAWLHTRRTIGATKYTPRYERPHTFDVVAAFALPDNVELNVRGIVASGQPTTPVVGVYQPPRYSPVSRAFDVRADRRILLGSLNSIRLPAYMRVDVGGRVNLQRTVLGRLTDIAVFAQIVNALNMTNTLYWNPTTVVLAPDDPVWQLPLTLTAGVEWSF